MLEITLRQMEQRDLNDSNFFSRVDFFFLQLQKDCVLITDHTDRSEILRTFISLCVNILAAK